MNNFKKCPQRKSADTTATAKPKHKAWNSGVSVGKKIGLTHQQVKSIFQHLTQNNHLRDLAIFSLATDSMLRAGDLMRLKVFQVAYSNGQMREQFHVRQQKTNYSVTCNITPTTAKILEQWIVSERLETKDFLFQGCGTQTHLSTRQYRRLVKRWVEAIQLPKEDYSTHSMRRTKSTIVYHKTGKDLQIVRLLLGQRSIQSTQEYIESDNELALSIAGSISLF